MRTRWPLRSFARAGVGWALVILCLRFVRTIFAGAVFFDFVDFLLLVR